MKTRWPTVAGLILLALVAGAIGAWGAERLTARQVDQQGLHGFVHDSLDLDAQQRSALARIEKDFAIERRSLDLALRSANAGLARAIQREHRNGPEVTHAVEVVHARMGDVEKATIAHLFAMRQLLDANQQSEFDARVTRSLTADPE